MLRQQNTLYMRILQNKCKKRLLRTYLDLSAFLARIDCAFARPTLLFSVYPKRMTPFIVFADVLNEI